MKQDSTNAQLDTFLNEQGTGVPTDTQGYGGLERDTSGQQGGATGADTSSMQQPGAAGVDTSSMQPGAGADSSYQPSGATGTDTSSMQSDSTTR